MRNQKKTKRNVPKREITWSKNASASLSPMMPIQGYQPNMHHGSMEWAPNELLAYSAEHKETKPHPEKSKVFSQKKKDRRGIKRHTLGRLAAS